MDSSSYINDILNHPEAYTNQDIKNILIDHHCTPEKPFEGMAGGSFKKIVDIINGEAAKNGGSLLTIAPVTALQLLMIMNHDRTFKAFDTIANADLLDTYPRLISMLVAPSGAGKEFNLKAVREVAQKQAIKVERSITSDKNVKEVLFKGRRKVFYAIDEAQGLLHQMTQKESYNKNIIPTLNQLITSDSFSLQSREIEAFVQDRETRKKFLEKKKEKNSNLPMDEVTRINNEIASIDEAIDEAQDEEKPDYIIKDFYLGAFMASQPHEFSPIVNRSHLSSGFLARTLFCFVNDGDVPEDRTGILHNTQSKAIERIIELLEPIRSKYRYADKWQQHTITEDAILLYNAIKLYFGQDKFVNDPVFAALYRRIAERTIQIAFAISSFTNEVTSLEIKYALKMAVQGIENIKTVYINNEGDEVDTLNFTCAQVLKKLSNSKSGMSAAEIRDTLKNSKNKPLKTSIALKKNLKAQGKEHNDYIDQAVLYLIEQQQIQRQGSSKSKKLEIKPRGAEL